MSFLSLCWFSISLQPGLHPLFARASATRFAPTLHGAKPSVLERGELRSVQPWSQKNGPKDAGWWCELVLTPITNINQSSIDWSIPSVVTIGSLIPCWNEKELHPVVPPEPKAPNTEETIDEGSLIPTHQQFTVELLNRSTSRRSTSSIPIFCRP